VSSKSSAINLRQTGTTGKSPNSCPALPAKINRFSSHSPYTKALATTIKQAGLDIFQTFNQVGLAVKRQTGGSQQPWVSSSPIDGNFYFVAPTPVASSQQFAAAAPPEPLQEIGSACS
jgi:hypothetical protein